MNKTGIFSIFLLYLIIKNRSSYQEPQVNYIIVFYLNLDYQAILCYTKESF